MRRVVLLLFLALAACSTPAPPSGVEPPEPYLVMVSFDGMRHDMIDRTETPAFDRLARAGARAAGIIPSYPSKTFPNHYTLATGLYPGNHGIVDNTFYDPAFDATYRIGDTTTVRDGRWYGGEPIWVTAERQGRTAASFFWVGSEAAIDGVRPTYFKYYDESVPYAARVDTVLAWLDLPADQRPRLVMLYFDEPDHSGHVEGPDAPAVDSVVRGLDAVLGQLLDGIAARPIAGQTHVLVMSDHGMEAVPPPNVVYLDDYVDLGGVRVINSATHALPYFTGAEDRLWSVYETLVDRLEHATVYLREETPVDWRYRDNRRIGELVVAAEPGWILREREWSPWRGGGTHGWDPAHPAMRGIFLGAGPAIRPGTALPAFENVHVYPLAARLLGLRPAPGIDGRLDPFAGMLRESSP